MKKYIIGVIVIVIVLIVAVYQTSEKQYDHGTASHIYYLCDSKAAPGGTSFTIEKKSDGQYHLVVASKPPQTDIVVTKNELGLFNYEYSGNGVDVKDSTSSLQVNVNGKALQNCHKLYPGT